MKNFYPIQVIITIFLIDHVNPEKIQLFEELLMLSTELLLLDFSPFYSDIEKSKSFQTEIKLPKIKFYRMIFSLDEFMKGCKLKDDTMKKSDLKQI